MSEKDGDKFCCLFLWFCHETNGKAGNKLADATRTNGSDMKSGRRCFPDRIMKW